MNSYLIHRLDRNVSINEGKVNEPQCIKKSKLSGPLYPKLSTCFEGAQLTQLVQLVTAGTLFLGHKGGVNL